MTARALYLAEAVGDQGGSFAAPVADAGKASAPDHGVSSGKSSAILSKACEGMPCDPHAIRRKFPGQWIGFLRAHFRDHVEVAFVFSVDEKTARHWWDGVTRPQGWAVEFAHHLIPNAPQWKAAA